MTNNRLTYLLPVVLTCMVAACTETYPGLTEDMSGDEIVEKEGMNDTVMANEEFKLVSVAISDPSYSTVISDTSATRGFGGFDLSRPDSMRRRLWDSAHFYLYAFRDTVNVNFTVTRQSDSVACLLDNEPSWMADPNGFVLSYVIDDKHDGHNWWNNKLSEVPYRFWSYYLDDAKILAHKRTAEQISLDFEIDGSQDILSGAAALTGIQHEKISKDSVLEALYDQYSERETSLEYLFCTTAARHDILPIVKLRHHLPRFKFEVYPGNAASEGMKIFGLDVFARTEGNLVVVAKDNEDLRCTFNENSLKWLTLHDKDNSSTLDPEKYVNHWKEEYETTLLYKRDHLDLGEGMMLPPTDNLRIRLDARMPLLDKETGEPVMDEETGEPAYFSPFEEMGISNVVTLNYDKGFKAGYLYTIRIVLYGDEPYKMNAILTGWDEKGNVDINPEDEDFKPY